jgi:acyl carrier protein
VSEAVVIVKTDSQGGDPQLVCCYTAKSPLTAAAADLRCHLAEKLPAHMIPGSFQEFAAFPLSHNGKVDRKALAGLACERQERATLPPASSASGLEDQIHAAWCQVLDRASAGWDDNFFDLGGDSLRLARLHRLLEALLQKEFPITDLFAHPTIRGMAQHLGNGTRASGKQELVRERARLQREAQSARRRNRG